MVRAAVTYAACLAVLPVAAGQAAAACPQALAVYGEAQAGAELAFGPAGEGPDPTLGRFTIRFLDGDLALEGVIMPSDEPDRPWGIVMHGCPEGDVTGAELAACMAWQGVIYAVDGEGGVNYLPDVEGGEAAATLLLPDFAGSLRHSEVWRKAGLATLPRDDFQLSRCRE